MIGELAIFGGGWYTFMAQLSERGGSDVTD